ncbi:MAG: hypothetical protein ACRDY5_05280 [Acidimicrobiales bacterium]
MSARVRARVDGGRGRSAGSAGSAGVRLRVVALVVAGAAFSVVGCSGGDDEPSLAEAGADLVAAGEAVLKEPARSAGYEVTDPGTDVPCRREGRAKRTFAGSGTIEAGGVDLDGYLDYAEGSVIGGAFVTLEGLGLELDRSNFIEGSGVGLDRADDLTGRVVLYTREEGGIRLRIRIYPNSSPEEFGRTPAGRSPGPYEVAGETACLKTG